MAERSPTRLYVSRVHVGYRVNEMQGMVLKTCPLCGRNCYFVVTSSAYKDSIFFTAVVLRVHNCSISTYQSCVKEAFVKQGLNAGLFLHNEWHKVNYTDNTVSRLVLEPRLTVYSCQITLYLCNRWLLCLSGARSALIQHACALVCVGLELSDCSYTVTRIVMTWQTVTRVSDASRKQSLHHDCMNFIDYSQAREVY